MAAGEGYQVFFRIAGSVVLPARVPKGNFTVLERTFIQTYFPDGIDTELYVRPTEKLDPKCFYLLHRHFGVLFQGFEDHELYDGCLIEVRLPSKYHKNRKQLSEVPEDAAALPPGVQAGGKPPADSPAGNQVAPADSAPADSAPADSSVTTTTVEELPQVTDGKASAAAPPPSGEEATSKGAEAVKSGASSRSVKSTKSLRAKIWDFLDEPTSSKASMIFTVVLMVLILLSTVTFVIETLPQFYRPNQPVKSFWFLTEAICISVFTVEVVARVLVCPNLYEYCSDGMNQIDVIAILPFYVEVLLSGLEVPGLAVFRVVRLVRIFRLFKVSRGSIQIFARTMSVSARPLYMLIFFTLLAMVIFSSLMYYAERGEYDKELGVWLRLQYYECPIVLKNDRPERSWAEFVGNAEDGGMRLCAGIYGAPCRLGENRTADGKEVAFYVPYNYKPHHLENRWGRCVPMWEQSPFESIPASFWWTLVTMTTVGYGDITPTYWYGKVLGSCVMFFGILVIALPITVIGSNFAQVYKTLTDSQASASGNADESDDEPEPVYNSDGEEIDPLDDEAWEDDADDGAGRPAPSAAPSVMSKG